jgi:hypothetical protein
MNRGFDACCYPSKPRDALLNLELPSNSCSGDLTYKEKEQLE